MECLVGYITNQKELYVC